MYNKMYVWVWSIMQKGDRERTRAANEEGQNTGTRHWSPERGYKMNRFLALIVVNFDGRGCFCCCDR